MGKALIICLPKKFSVMQSSWSRSHTSIPSSGHPLVPTSRANCYYCLHRPCIIQLLIHLSPYTHTQWEKNSGYHHHINSLLSNSYCVYALVCLSEHRCERQRTTCRSQFSFTIWVPWIDLRSSVLSTSTFIIQQYHWPLLLAFPVSNCNFLLQSKHLCILC